MGTRWALKGSVSAPFTIRLHTRSGREISWWYESNVPWDNLNKEDEPEPEDVYDNDPDNDQDNQVFSPISLGSSRVMGT